MKFKLAKIKIATALLAIGGVTNVAMAGDENLGCTFVLCMAAKNPLGIAECVSPVKKVLKMVKKGKRPPICKMANGKEYGYTIIEVIDGKKTTIKPPTNDNEAVITYSIQKPEEDTTSSLMPLYCPKGYQMTNTNDGAMYHSGKMPFNYTMQRTADNSKWETVPFSKFRISNVNTYNLFNNDTATSRYKQRVCVAGKMNGMLFQESPNLVEAKKGVYQTHIWYDNVVLLTGSDANALMDKQGKKIAGDGVKPLGGDGETSFGFYTNSQSHSFKF